MKTCFKCRRDLPLSDFYPHPQMTDGRLGKCKECARRDARANRAAKRDQYNEFDRRRSKTPERLALLGEMRRKHREHHLARIAVQNAVRRGTLTRQPCEVCGDPKTDGHHDDYSKRLDVRWLCRTHHMERHRMATPF